MGMYRSINKFDTLLLLWLAMTAILAVLFIGFNTDLELEYRVIITLGGSLTVMYLILYNIKVHISLMLFFLSELCYIVISDRVGGEWYINNVFIISAVCMFSGIYMLVKNTYKLVAKYDRCREKSTYNLINGIIYTNMKPFKIPSMIRFVLIACMISVTFSMSLMYIQVYPGLSWLNVLYMLLPTFIAILSIVPIKEVVYLRAIYFVMWIAVAYMGIGKGVSTWFNIIEPLVYLIVIFSSEIIIGGKRE